MKQLKDGWERFSQGILFAELESRNAWKNEREDTQCRHIPPVIQGPSTARVPRDPTYAALSIPQGGGTLNAHHITRHTYHNITSAVRERG